MGGELGDLAARGIQGGQGDTGNGGGQGKRQVDHRLYHLASWEGVTHQSPGQQRADNAVDYGGREGSGKAQLERCQYPRCGNNGPEFSPGRKVIEAMIDLPFAL